MATESIVVKVIDFKHGPRYARSFGGKFDGTTKLWTIARGKYNEAIFNCVEIGRESTYGLQLVSRFAGEPAPVTIDTCNLWTLDQGCPLHGELCARGRN